MSDRASLEALVAKEVPLIKLTGNDHRSLVLVSDEYLKSQVKFGKLTTGSIPWTRSTVFNELV
jgi:hypothetical protein